VHNQLRRGVKHHQQNNSADFSPFFSFFPSGMETAQGLYARNGGNIKYQPQFLPHLHILTPFLFFSMGSGSCKKRKKKKKVIQVFR
jgi:hypothetical protein